MELTLDLLKLFLPEFLIDNFDIVRHYRQDETLHLYFEEKNIVPKEYSSGIIIAHGFHKEITIQDFPIRGNTVYLHVKRRRWLDKNNRQIVQRNWKLVAKGTRMTEEFSTFLKEISRY